jgi:hypothetical protein
MASKYDEYWARRLDEIGAAVARAATGQPAVLALGGLTRAGQRDSWQGVAVVRSREVTYTSMAHATSLGRLIAERGICVPWPDLVFRFAIARTGDALTVSLAPGQPRVPATRAARPRRPAITAFDTRRPGPGAALPGAGGPDAERFYQLLGRLSEIVGGPRLLRDSRGPDGWPRRGVYFFFEPGEIRAGGGMRVVRVGTHALTQTSQTILWGRLVQHRGPLTGRHAGGGNHRASVFRRHVGAALIQRAEMPGPLLRSWLDRDGPRPGQEEVEAQVEQMVSAWIGGMPFLWLDVPLRPDRAFIERNSIALTSCMAGGRDPASPGWLGRHAQPAEIRQSALWNVQHVEHQREPGFLDRLDVLIRRHQPAR